MWIAIGIAFVSTSIAVLLGLMLRGAIRMHSDDLANYKVRHLTGREIEIMRRKVLQSGISSVSLQDVMGLITTLNMIQLGNYEDTDPFSPADPYEGLEP